MTTSSFSSIPTVDLAPMSDSAAGRTALADEVREICHEVGFFIAVGHGIERGLVDRVFDTMRTFFALPDEHKQLIDKRTSRHFRG